MFLLVLLLAINYCGKQWKFDIITEAADSFFHYIATQYTVFADATVN